MHHAASEPACELASFCQLASEPAICHLTSHAFSACPLFGFGWSLHSVPSGPTFFLFVGQEVDIFYIRGILPTFFVASYKGRENQRCYRWLPKVKLTSPTPPTEVLIQSCSFNISSFLVSSSLASLLACRRRGAGSRARRRAGELASRRAGDELSDSRGSIVDVWMRTTFFHERGSATPT